MMKYLLLLLLLVGCVYVVEETSVPAGFEADPFSVKLSTDKSLVHSAENIHIISDIHSPIEGDATVRFYGIYSKKYWLDHTQPVFLTKGQNVVTLDYRAPKCNTCSGIKEGSYDIEVDLIVQGETVATSITTLDIR